MSIYPRLQDHNGVKEHKTPQIRWQSTVQGFKAPFLHIVYIVRLSYMISAVGE